MPLLALTVNTSEVLHSALSRQAMHCSANVGPDGDSALFFGLSGTGTSPPGAERERGGEDTVTDANPSARGISRVWACCQLTIIIRWPD